MEENKGEDLESKKTEVQASEKEKGFFEELLGEALNLDKGIFATIFNMFKNPGLVIESYFTDRKRFTNPFRYAFAVLAVTTLIVTFVVDYEQFFKDAMEVGMQAGSDKSLEELSAQMKEVAPNFDFEEYMQNVQDVSIALSTRFNSILYIVVFAPVTSLFTFLFYSGRRKRFVEHYVMNLYGMTQGAIFTTLLTPIALLMGKVEVYFAFVTTGVLIGYLCWVIYSYIPGKGFGDVVKTLIALILSYGIFSIILAIIMYIGAAIKMFYF